MNEMITIKVVDNQYIISNWKDIKVILSTSFDQSDFNAGYNIDTVLEEVEKNSLEKKLALNIIASRKQEILGGIFSIEPNTDASEIYYDIGWLFTSSKLNKKERISIAISMVEEVHNLLRKMKYKYISTEIGTKQGISLLSRKFHYKKYKDTNYWFKKL